MSPWDLLRFALRALSGHRLRTTLTLLGMAVGVAAVIALTALGEGARRYVIDQFASIGTNLLVVVPGRTETTGFMPGVSGIPHDLTLDDAEAIRRSIPEVRRIAPLAMGTETVARRERRRQVAVVGSTPEFLPVRRLQLRLGEFLPPDEPGRGRPVVVLGKKAADELFPGENPVGKVVRVGGWRMRVIGVLAPRGVQLGLDLDEVVVIPVATAMRMFNRTSLFRILVEARTHTELEAAREKVVRLLAERHGEEDVTVLTQDAVVSTFSAILRALTLALGAIAAISLSVAGIGIMNVLLVAVAERTPEIGLLKAVGAGRRQILGVFLAEAGLLSVAGGLLGLAVGWVAVRILVGLFPALPATPPAWALVSALALSLAVGMAFGLLPAHRAAALEPVRALVRRK